MDAAKTYFSKTVLFLATALLMVVPGRAQSFNLNSSNTNLITVSPTTSTAAPVFVAGTLADATTPISFAVSGPNYAAGDSAWLSVSASGPLTTPVTLYFAIGAQAGQLQPGLHTATETLSAAGVPSATITIQYYANGSTSGGGTVTASQTSVPLSAASGSSTSTTVTLTTASTTSFTFTVTASASSGNTTWLTATANTNSLISTSYAILTVGANAAALGNGTYYGSITITPSSGGSATQINVSFTVGAGGGGGGSLSASPSTITWNYTTGSGVFPAGQLVNLTSLVGATTYTASVDSTSTWLYANYIYPNTYGAISQGITVSPNTASMGALATGNYTGYVHVSDQNGNPATITVNLVVNGGTTSGVTWSPNPAVLPTAAVGGSTVSLTVYLNSSTAGTFSASVANITGTGLYVSGVTTTNTNPAAGYVVVYGNPSGLVANTYSGYLYVTLSPTAGGSVNQTIPISFPVGSGTYTTPGIVTPTSLTFAYQTGIAVSSTTMPSQSVVISGTGAYTVSAPTYGTGQTAGWLTTPTSGTAPGSFAVTIAPGALAANSSPYTATVTVTTANGGVATVSVSLLVTASPILVAYPGSLVFTYTAGGGAPSSPLYLNASDGSALAVSVSIPTSTTWLSVSGQTQPTTGTVLTVNGTNLSSLANGVYTGSVTVTAAGAANSPVNVPVVLTVTGSSATGGGTLTLSPSSMTFNATQNATAPPNQTLSVSATNSTNYTATASSSGNWLSVSPSGSLTAGVTASNLTVSVNQSGLTANTYYGTITLVANGVTQTVQVTLVVSTSTVVGGSGDVTVTANNTAGTPSLTFLYQVAGNPPTVQTLQVSSASGSSPVSFTIASSATWLSAGVQNGTSLNTPVSFTVSIVNPGTLAAGPYNATITITPTGGTVVTVPVSLMVQAAPTVSATPTTLSFAYQAGNTNPTPATVSVSGGGQALAFTALVTSGNNWLSVTPNSGITPTTGTTALTVTATPGTMGAGTYNGTIVVTGVGSATGSTSVNVSLTVTAPLPTITSVVNAASFVAGAVSPGELVTIFGTAIGPAVAAGAITDPSTGKLATTIGGVQVLFNGIPAPMIYASNTQVSAVVPYEIAPIASPSVWVKYVGQTSNAYPLTRASTMPGVFTQNSSGSGPGAILNQDNSLNGPGTPAAKGSTVQLFMTGEGSTSPQGVTGSLTTATLPPPQVTPAPLLPVAVLINGQPANWTYAGEAPGLVAGVMQLNVQIPATTPSGAPFPSGALSITVSIGPNMSQNGVTVSVR